MLAGIAVVLAVSAALWLILWPNFYQGLSASPEGQGGVHVTASLIEVNGYRALLPLLTPVAVVALAFLAVRRPARLSARRKVAIWASAVTMVFFCLAALFSIGLFYVPAAAALFAASLASRQRGRDKSRSVKGVS